ncbi:MAG TPA: sulfite exporter TauE/SafE family protein [Pseudosphingobacterium sp.]|nr:sulfite exporter TauE/SafE family protein [Pseudosphingobacterium sp.]
MEVIGFFAASLIGVSLGLIGGGGSILTVPVLVYIFAVNPTLSTSYSLFIVGSTSLIGALGHYHRDELSLHTAFLFGFPSIVTIWLTRKFLIPAIPETFFQIGNVTVTKSLSTMVLFATLMILASLSMIKDDKGTSSDATVRMPSHSRLLIYAIAIGLVTGLLGAGGGFLLIPALIYLMHLPMKKAIGTSLLIIAVNSLIGFLGDLGRYPTDWVFLTEITGIAIFGVLLGSALSKKIGATRLKKGFGWFVLIIGMLILVNQLLY